MILLREASWNYYLSLIKERSLHKISHYSKQTLNIIITDILLYSLKWLLSYMI
jgi:hypothetical protein